MPSKVSAIAIAKPEYAPGKYVLFRMDADKPNRAFVWCGRSMGWLPLTTTSNAFFAFFDSREAATEAADKWVTLPLQE